MSLFFSSIPFSVRTTQCVSANAEIINFLREIFVDGVSCVISDIGRRVDCQAFRLSGIQAVRHSGCQAFSNGCKCNLRMRSLQVEIVSSLLLSMLKQMFAEDRNDSVRATVIKSLALVMTIVESATKYKEVLLNTIEGGYVDYIFGREGPPTRSRK